MGFEQLMPAIAGMRWQDLVMIAIGLILIYLAIAKNYEPTLLLPMGFGAILVNIPLSSAITPVSYTHLDVYKRQLSGHAKATHSTCFRIGGCWCFSRSAKDCGRHGVHSHKGQCTIA